MTRSIVLLSSLSLVLWIAGCPEFRDVLDGDTGLADDDATADDDDATPGDDDDATPGDDDDATPGDDDTTFGDDDDATPGDDDDTTAGDDDDATPGDDDDATPGDDDDTTAGDDDDTTAGDDDDATPGDDDDTTAGDDDDTTEPAFPSCHPWDPIDLTGAQWIYQSSYQFIVQGQPQGDSGTETVQTGGVTTFEGATVFQRLGEFAGSQFQVEWAGYDDCAVDGNHDHGSAANDTGGKLAVTTVNSSPVVYLPADPDLNVGATWTSSYTQDVDINGTAGSYQATWQWEVAGVVSVTVPAGTFDAVHVRAEYESEDPLGPHEGTLDAYWVEGLGLVRWDEQRPAEGGQYILRELQSYSGPLAPQ